MTHRLFILFIAIFASLFMEGANNVAFYLQRLRDPDLNPRKKLEYTDSLLSHDFTKKDSLLKLKATLFYDLSDFRSYIDLYENYLEPHTWGDISEKCRLMFYYIVSLKHKKQYQKSIQGCSELLNLQKPDSLIYYDAMVYDVMNGFSRQTHVPMREDYLQLTNNLLSYSQEKNLPSHVINKIRRELHTIRLEEAIHSNNFSKAIEESDMLLSIPLSDKERESLYTNIGYLYMIIGQHEAAEQYFIKLLDSGKSLYNLGITLLNYTHMLNEQGRYEKTMDLFEKYGYAAEGLNKDIYYSHLLGNRAMAESHTIGYEKAFNTMIENKYLEDSLYFNDNVQDNLLLFDYKTKVKEADRLQVANFNKKIIIILLGVALGIMGGLAGFFAIRSRKNASAKSALALKEAQSASKCEELEREMTRKAEGESARIASQMLQFAAFEETLNHISDIISIKTKSDGDKIKLVENTISSMKIDGESRELFRTQFDQAHSQFFKKLYGAHPDLTQGETRMCAYIIMNLSTKEIAAITSKSTRSVESTRYRLNKKFNLPEGKTLLSYLREFL